MLRIVVYTSGDGGYISALVGTAAQQEETVAPIAKLFEVKIEVNKKRQ
jgi:hypothetical protein